MARPVREELLRSLREALNAGEELGTWESLIQSVRDLRTAHDSHIILSQEAALAHAQELQRAHTAHEETISDSFRQDQIHNRHLHELRDELTAQHSAAISALTVQRDATISALTAQRDAAISERDAARTELATILSSAQPHAGHVPQQAQEVVSITPSTMPTAVPAPAPAMASPPLDCSRALRTLTLTIASLSGTLTRAAWIRFKEEAVQVLQLHSVPDIFSIPDLVPQSALDSLLKRVLCHAFKNVSSMHPLIERRNTTGAELLVDVERELQGSATLEASQIGDGLGAARISLATSTALARSLNFLTDLWLRRDALSDLIPPFSERERLLPHSSSFS